MAEPVARSTPLTAAIPDGQHRSFADTTKRATHVRDRLSALERSAMTTSGAAADRFTIELEPLPRGRRVRRVVLSFVGGLLSWSPGAPFLSEVVVRDRRDHGKIGAVGVASGGNLDMMLDRLRSDAREMSPEEFCAAWSFRAPPI
jgi:hypothetical protein